MARAGGETIGFLDIGSSKVCLMVGVARSGATPGASDAYDIIGIGHQRSAGVKAGVVVDLDQAEVAVRAALGQAERMAGRTVDCVHVAVSCGRLKSLRFAAHAETENRIVADADIARALNGGRSYAERDGRTLIHLNRLGYRLDGLPGVADPRGMACRRLSIDLHAVTADETPVRNLLLLVERCLLPTAGLVAAPHASAVAVTSLEERQLGAIIVDIGGGATTLAMFAEGHFIHTDAVAVGGYHATCDIARTLVTPVAEAERIKTLYGTMAAARSDEQETITYPLVGGEEAELHQTTRAEVNRLVRQRMTSLLALIRERIELSGMSGYAGERVVLTGGGSQLPGLGEFAAEVLGRPCRVGRPVPVGRLPTNVCSPAFSTVIGLVLTASLSERGVPGALGGSASDTGYLGRMTHWLRASF